MRGGVKTDISAGEQFMDEVDDLGWSGFVFARFIEGNLLAP